MEDKITSIFSKNESDENLETSPEIAESARQQLETIIKNGAKSIVFIAEKGDGFDFRSSPSSVFLIIGAVKAVYDLFSE